MKDFRIIYADAEQNNLNAFIAYFRRKDFQIVTCLNSDDLYNEVSVAVPKLIVIDQKILERIGIEYFQKAQISIIALTANRSFESLELAYHKGEIVKYLCKPFEMEVLNEIIEDTFTSPE